MKRVWLLSSLVLVLLIAVFFHFALHEDSDVPQVTGAQVEASVLVARGSYLARAGDCMACHTVRGGQSFAGGRTIATPFGNFISPNITSDTETGIGSWTADDFWRALHNGKSKDGRLLYPAFPYTNYTKVTRADSDAMFAFFKTVPAIRKANQPHELRFPYNQRLLLAGWRALYFRPGVYQADSKQTVEWNRGAYLVQGLGHCSACHTTRNVLGATDTKADLAGGLIPILNWYAPSLTSDAEAGLGKWEPQQISDLLRSGISSQGTVFGPMAEVVYESLQHLSDTDINAMAGYLKTIPQISEPPEAPRGKRQDIDQALALGAKLYEKHCMDCHKAAGEGVPPAYPPLAGNRAITMHSPVNPIRVVLNGGFAPGTAANPRPYGMPPFGPAFTDTEVAAVVSYIRNNWGNSAALVLPSEVSRYRSVPLD